MSQQINLYQPSFRRQEQKFSARTMLLAGLTVIGATILLGALNLWQVSRLEAGVRDMDAQYAVVLERFQTINSSLSVRPRDRALEQQVERMQRLIEGRYRVQELLREGAFTNTDGFSPYFLALARQHVAGLWLTNFDITGAAEHMTLKGRSRQPEFVPRYIQKLAEENVLSGTEFRVFHMTRPQAAGKSGSRTLIEFVLSTEQDLLAEDAPVFESGRQSLPWTSRRP